MHMLSRIRIEGADLARRVGGAKIQPQSEFSLKAFAHVAGAVNSSLFFGILDLGN